MQRSGNKSTHNKPDNGQRLAILAESLYLANLLILPILAFILLVIIFFKKHDSVPALAQSHLEQTIAASILIGMIFFTLALMYIILNFSGANDVTIWMILIILFTTIHASMVLLGVVGLSKALAGKCWSYPLIGKSLPKNCPQ